MQLQYQHAAQRGLPTCDIRMPGQVEINTFERRAVVPRVHAMSINHAFSEIADVAHAGGGIAPPTVLPPILPDPLHQRGSAIINSADQRHHLPKPKRLFRYLMTGAISPRGDAVPMLVAVGVHTLILVAARTQVSSLAWVVRGRDSTRTSLLGRDKRLQDCCGTERLHCTALPRGGGFHTHKMKRTHFLTVLDAIFPLALVL